LSQKQFKNNVHVYKKKHNINIGSVLFGVILIYLLVTIFAYVTANHVAVYEIQEGSILRDTSYYGMILREETVVKSEKSGYINFFATEGSKVGRLTDVYSISKEELKFDETAKTEEEVYTLTSEEQNSVIFKSQTFMDTYKDVNFDATYQYKDSVSNIISTNSTQSRQAQLNDMIEKGMSGVTLHNPIEDGVIIYSMDGYESLSVNKITKDILSGADYQRTEIHNNTMVNKNDSIYKLITSDDWSIVIELDEAMAEELSENSSVRIRFKKDNEVARAGFEIQKSKDMILGVLTLDHSMVRYANERFIDLELILEDEKGLKIPKSSVVEKEFYLVPSNYITQGGNSNSSGVLVRGKNSQMEFKEVSIYNKDAETGMVYLGMDKLKENTVLVKPDSSETYQLSQKASLQGVYNINKGYAVFRRVNILCESDEYYIVQAGLTYGLTNYDHIALDGDSIKENDVVF